MNGTRSPAVAGQFYSGTREGLIRQVEECFRHRIGPGALPPKSPEDGERLRGGVAPHAGLMYSGPVAAHLYWEIARTGTPETYVIIGPNHSGYGSAVALSTMDFSTPLGVMRRDVELCGVLANNGVTEDDVAHGFEHSLEVQLPFIQYINPNARIVALCMGDQSHRAAVKLGERIRKAAEGRHMMIIASTDFSHYVPPEDAKRLDSMAVEAILSHDTKQLDDVVHHHHISMCGYGPVMAMLEAVQPKGSKLLRYATSGDIAPMREVVGYAAIAAW
ncbi:MAG: AmmeMemoRadiSam system protein B [Candidatus Thermoplasmatota archaeon]